MIYLASPYSHPDPAVRDQRYVAACRATVRLLLAGKSVFSPIVHGHPLVQLGLSGDWLFWARHDQWHLSRCDEVLVLAIPGWDESEGVQAEIHLAQRLGKVVRYFPESTLPGRDVAPVSPSTSHQAHPAQRAPERDVGQRGAIEKKGCP
jgi:Domain of unknown function (DUF1937)